MHIGLIIIGIEGMHRKHLGAKVFVSLFDSRFTDPEQAMLGCMEVDMNEGGQIVYFVLDYLIATKIFEDNIRFAIKTKGYQMNKGSDNLLIHTGYIGRLSNNSTTNFKIIEDELIATLSSKGIKAIGDKKFKFELNERLDWEIDILDSQISVPQKNVMHKHNNGNVSIRFSHYTKQGQPFSPPLLEKEEK